VADSGPGIAPEVRPHLFEPYFTTKEAGTGLGLAISDRIVREHGGRIEVESEPGKGTTFSVCLPVAG
jgi:signal transduction histidine kinase